MLLICFCGWVQFINEIGNPPHARSPFPYKDWETNSMPRDVFQAILRDWYLYSSAAQYVYIFNVCIRGWQRYWNNNTTKSTNWINIIFRLLLYVWAHVYECIAHGYLLHLFLCLNEFTLNIKITNSTYCTEKLTGIPRMLIWSIRRWKMNQKKNNSQLVHFSLFMESWLDIIKNFLYLIKK